MIKILPDGNGASFTPQRNRYRGYTTEGDRDRAITQLRKIGFNYFVPYRDVKSQFALTAGWADWVAPGQFHVDSGDYHRSMRWQRIRRRAS